MAFGPFEGDELELVRDSLANLHSIDFFRKFADYKSANLIKRYDSISAADRLVELERLSAERAVLLNLAQEAARAYEAISASETQETQNELSVE